MNKIIGSIFMIVLSLYLVLIFREYSQDYDKSYVDIEVTAVENTASSEYIYVNELIYEITDIHIDGIHQNIDDVLISINVVEDGEIVLVANASGAGDLIEITYSYVIHPAEYTTQFIDVIPLIMVVIIITGIGYLIIKRS